MAAVAELDLAVRARSLMAPTPFIQHPSSPRRSVVDDGAVSSTAVALPQTAQILKAYTGATVEQQPVRSPRPSRAERSYVTPFVSTVCGAIGGAISTVATNPLDVVRTRLQASRVANQHMGSKSMVETMRILVQSGLRGMCTGLMPNLAASVPARSMYFLFYSQAKTVAAHCTDNSSTQTAVAALLSMCGVTLCMNPLFVLRVRAQLQPESNVRSIAGDILRTTGLRGFYRGMAIGIAGRSFENVCYWLIYERLKEKTPASGGSNLAMLPLQIFGASLVAKTAASVLSYPHMVVQTHIREVDPATGRHPHQGIFRTAKAVWRADSVRGFYSGLTPHLVRVLPSTGLAFLTYEMLVRGLGYST